MARGLLRIYLGASPGVGKTFAMLNEGTRRRERGTDVVIGVVETHGRKHTAEQLGELEVVPRRQVQHRGASLTEMDVEAILARRPDVVLVDEYAHTNAPGSVREKRWQDVEVLLDAGIEVISTVNIQHLESLNDVIRRITGVVQGETVPDHVVRRADQIELVDMSPEAIRRRMAHGNIYPPERVDAAMSHWFRPGNLGALRELALLWLADRVEEALKKYQDSEGITDSWETRERVVVGITGAVGGDVLIRRAARIAGRVQGDLIGVHVADDAGLRSATDKYLGEQRQLIEQLGGTAHEIVGPSRAESLVQFARGQRATQLVLGASQRSKTWELIHGSFVGEAIRLAGNIDIHVIATAGSVDDDDDEQRTSRRSAIDTFGGRRRRIAWVVALLSLPLLTLITTHFRDGISLQSDLSLFLVLVIALSAIGGRVVAAVSAVSASLLVNWYLVEPLHTLSIAEGDNAVSLVVFLLVALTIGSLVDSAARRAFDVGRARIEAEAFARAAVTLGTSSDPLPALVDQLRRTYGFDSARLIKQSADPGLEWTDVAVSGALESRLGEPAIRLAIGDDAENGHRLELFGRTPTADDLRVIRILADQLGVAIDARHLATDAAEAQTLAVVDQVRTALLRAVSHDLRTPLASIKAMVSGLLDTTVDWSADQLHEALLTIDQESDRLNRVVGNLLDASRLQAGALAIELSPVDVYDLVTQTLQQVGDGAEQLSIDLAGDLPLINADAALLERSLVNIVSNAIRYAPNTRPRVTAARIGDRVHICVVDSGPGIPVQQRHRVVAPFQRLDDRRSDVGVGLGLSIAQGFVIAMGGTLSLDDTPGGGLTVTIEIGVAD